MRDYHQPVMDDYGGVLAKQPTGMSKSKKITIIVICLMLLAVGIGVGAGVGLHNSNKSVSTSASQNQVNGNGSSSDNGSPTSVSTNSTTTTTTNGGNQSQNTSTTATIKLNPALHRVFWGMDYNSDKSQYNTGCGVTQQDVNADLSLLYQLTPRVRLYGMDCNQTRYVLEGMRQLNIKMGITVTIYLDSNKTTVNRQLNEFWSLMDIYGYDLITAISMGNEVIYGDLLTLDELDQYIQQMKSNLTAKNQGSIPVTTTDATTYAKSILPIVDVFAVNAHPFFGHVPGPNAANWTLNYFENKLFTPAQAVGKGAAVSETGWPTNGTNSKGDPPSVDTLNTFLNDYLCTANSLKYPTYWFELKDEPYKQRHSAVEGSWGLFDQYGTLKSGVTIPDCGGNVLPLFTTRDGKGN